jgi:hypothetical protein
MALEDVAKICRANPNLGGVLPLSSVRLPACKQFNDLIGGVVVWIHTSHYRHTLTCEQANNLIGMWENPLLSSAREREQSKPGLFLQT